MVVYTCNPNRNQRQEDTVNNIVNPRSRSARVIEHDPASSSLPNLGYLGGYSACYGHMRTRVWVPRSDGNCGGCRHSTQHLEGGDRGSLGQGGYLD